MVAFVLGTTGSLGADLRAALYRFRFALLLVLVHASIVAAVARLTDTAANFGMIQQGLWFSQSFILPYVILFVAYRAACVIARDRPERPLRAIAQDLVPIFASQRRLVEGLLVLIIFLTLMGGFSQIKDRIPILVPFSWDETFFLMDRALFLGHDPWRLLWPLLGSPEATFIVNFCYNLWIFLIYFLMISVAFSQTDPERKIAFVVAFILIWAIGGNLLATAFSSAGPVYYERLGLGSDYAELMTRLALNHAVYPVWALDVQEMLWASYAHGVEGPSGISAMPSMHNASTVLMALFAFRVSRTLGWLCAAFAVMIFLGSIHLGWHYAVDGLFGVVIAWVCWRAGLWVARLSLPERPA